MRFAREDLTQVNWPCDLGAQNTSEYMERRDADERVCLGIDAGSTTLKLVVIEPGARTPRASVYLRHHGDLASSLDEALGRVARGLDAVRLFVTGTAGQRIAERLGVPHLHEVPAVLATVRATFSDVGCVLDLGGQDAKLARLERGGDGRVRRVQSSMNDRCAAGTGVTIDRCLARLGVTPEVARAVRYEPAKVRPVSSKCGVFAETDLVNLARSGVAVDVLVISLVDAVVSQNLAVLARGASLTPRAVLLGGVSVHLPSLAAAWAHHLGRIWRAQGLPAASDGVIVPENALYYGAIGACLLGVERAVPSPANPVRTLAARLAEDDDSRGLDLAERPIARDEFEARAALDASPRRAPARLPVTSAGHVTVGIDAGSTVFKAVALSPRGEVLAHASRESRDPIADAREIVRDLERALDTSGWRVRSIGVTGYGAGLVAPVVGAQTRVLETVAHARAARAFAPDADLVCDVGGQDVKVLALDASGAIRDFRLSSQCDAGIGLALEATARQLGVGLDQIAARALAARRAPRFGDGCVVFLDADRVGFQRQGYSTDEILSGMVRALPRLVWERIARGILDGARPRAVVLQGGVHRNAAAALAQREHLAAALPGVPVRVHPWCGEAGAIGAAHCALDDALEGAATSAARVSLAVVNVTARAAPDTRCTLCASGCPRTFLAIETADGATHTHVTGHACEAGAQTDLAVGRSLARRKLDAIPNLLADEARILFARRTDEVPLSAPPTRVRIGIPRTLSMYRSAPFFRFYLQALGVLPEDVVFSAVTSERLWREGSEHGATDPCFPVKVTLAHAHHLLTRVHGRGRRLDAILAPRSTHASIPVRHGLDCASCPVVQASPVMLHAAFGMGDGVLDREGIRLLDGPVTLTDPPRLRAQMHAMFGPLLGTDRARSDLAIERGFAAMRAVDDRLRRSTASVLARIGRGDGPGPAAVLVLCRPYHADPGLNHRVGEELQALGYPTLTIRSLPREEGYLRELMAPDLASGAIEDPFDVRDLCDDATNSGGLERLWAARFAARHGRLGVVDLSSFKCAQDPPLARVTRRVLDGGGVVSCALHDLDETRPVASLRVRLATFAHALAAKGLLPWTC